MTTQVLEERVDILEEIRALVKVRAVGVHQGQQLRKKQMKKLLS